GRRGKPSIRVSVLRRAARQFWIGTSRPLLQSRRGHPDRRAAALVGARPRPNIREPGSLPAVTEHAAAVAQGWQRARTNARLVLVAPGPDGALASTVVWTAYRLPARLGTQARQSGGLD